MENPTQKYQEILKRIPHENIEFHSFKENQNLSKEESELIQCADHYYKQLLGPLQEVIPRDSTKELLILCEEIQKLVPVVEPENPTREFLELQSGKSFKNKSSDDKSSDDKSSDESSDVSVHDRPLSDALGRVHNYFNQKMDKILDKTLTVQESMDAFKESSNDYFKADEKEKEKASKEAIELLLHVAQEAEAKHEEETKRAVELLMYVTQKAEAKESVTDYKTDGNEESKQNPNPKPAIL